MTYHTIDKWGGYRLLEMRDQEVVIDRWIEYITGDNNWREIENEIDAYRVCRDRLAELAKERNVRKNNEILKDMINGTV